MGWVRGIPPGAARGVPAGRRRHLRESGMRYAVGVPNVGDYGDPRLLVELARDAEAAGWDAVLLWDHVAYRRRGWPVADPTVTLTAVAAATSRVRVGLLATAIPRRRPWKLARETATLDLLS